MFTTRPPPFLGLLKYTFKCLSVALEGKPKTRIPNILSVKLKQKIGSFKDQLLKIFVILYNKTFINKTVVQRNITLLALFKLLPVGCIKQNQNARLIQKIFRNSKFSKIILLSFLFFIFKICLKNMIETSTFNKKKIMKRKKII